MIKKLLFWLTFALVALGALYFAVRMPTTALGRDTAAPTGRISIYPGRGSLTARDITDALKIRSGGSVYSVNLAQVLSNITALPDVKDAAVRRLPNGRILVRISQRAVVAVWTDGLNFYPLANDGRAIRRPLKEKPDGMLVFAGDLPDNIGLISRAIKREASIFPEIIRVEWIESRRWNLYTHAGVKIMLPEAGWDRALSRLGTRQKQTQILHREISVLDMRDAARTLVKLGNP